MYVNYYSKKIISVLFTLFISLAVAQKKESSYIFENELYTSPYYKNTLFEEEREEEKNRNILFLKVADQLMQFPNENVIEEDMVVSRTPIPPGEPVSVDSYVWFLFVIGFLIIVKSNWKKIGTQFKI